MPAPPIIHDLVRAFKKDEPTYYGKDYPEAQVRISYVDPFLEALGWHPRPDTAYIAEWRDCIVEKPLDVKEEPHKKRADYTCRIGKTPILIVEAKAPREDIFTRTEHALQVRSYAHSENLTVGALTNFAQLAVYDGRIPPKKDDTAQVAQLETIRFTEYVEKWDLIESLLGKDAVQRGAQREYIQRKVAKGLMPVDQAILAEIDRWREELAHVIARLNPELDADTLGFAVGRIIDRLLFLRVCEGRRTEPEGQLRNLNRGPNTYQRLLHLFHLADKRYNSGLFYFKKEHGRAEKPDLLALRLQVEDKPLKQIINGLYYPENLYQWSVIPVEILGQVYEQFLGKVVVVPRRGSARIEDKPEVKKAGGVYYTPSYIVNYIVEHTVGKLLEGKTPNDVEKLRVLDPACGSGSFLLGAYQYLLDWYLKYYMKDGPAKHQKEISPDIYEGYRLTLRERKRILKAHIYGVDIDAQAVEVTKLSMHLKVLEGETHDTVESELKLRERALPDLGRNIKCGNSLIGTDILTMSFPPVHGGTKGGLDVHGGPSQFPPARGGMKGGSRAKEGRTLTDDEIRHINPFDWQKEFPAIFKDGGFDAVIGNPPYRMLQPHNTPEELLAYLRACYVAAEFKIDLFHMFFQRGGELLADGGRLGFIAPTTLLNNVYAQTLRSWLMSHCAIEEIAVALDRVFEQADVHTSVYVLRRESREQARAESVIRTVCGPAASFTMCPAREVRQHRFLNLPGNVWNVALSEVNAPLISRLVRSYPPLKTIGEVNRGLITGDKKSYFSATKQTKKHVPIIAGADVWRFHTQKPTQYVLFKRPDSAGGCWDEAVHFAPHKIVIRQIGKSPTASVVRSPLAVTGNIFTIRTGSIERDMFVLGIINSRLMSLFWSVMFADFKSSFPQVTIFSLEQLPIRPINFSDRADKARHDKMVKLVEHMLKLHQDLQSEWVGPNQEAIERQIKATDEEIDKLVYELYGLTEEEIRIVEHST